MSFDWVREQLNPDSELPDTDKELISCARCTRRRWAHTAKKVGNLYYCPVSCYDEPIGEGVHRRGDE